MGLDYHATDACELFEADSLCLVDNFGGTACYFLLQVCRGTLAVLSSSVRSCGFLSVGFQFAMPAFGASVLVIAAYSSHFED